MIQSEENTELLTPRRVHVDAVVALCFLVASPGHSCAIFDPFIYAFSVAMRDVQNIRDTFLELKHKIFQSSVLDLFKYLLPLDLSRKRFINTEMM